MLWNLSLSPAALGACGAVVGAAATASALVVRGLCLVRVQGESMLPTLRPEDAVLCRRYGKGRPPRTGDLVIVQREGFPPLLVKRVLASPGEVLPPEISVEESRLPEGRYFLIADNDSQPYGTRWLGPVERTEIQARACWVIWPWRRWCRLN